MSAKKASQKTTDPVFKQHGVPFLTNKKGKVTINDRAVAVKCATQYSVKFNEEFKSFERYDTGLGLWISISETKVIQLVDALLIELGGVYRHEKTVQRLTAAKLNALAKMLRFHNAQINLVDTAGLVHVRNGVVQLGEGEAKLLDHDARFAFRHSSRLTYDPKATCPKFLQEFLVPALEPEDIRLLQMYCGSMLLGPNSCHGLMVIRGTPGGGKSTLVSIIEKVIGESNVAHLRTPHLNGRFETSAFLGKRLLVGKDVPGDTLAVKGARMLKSLIGGDLMEAEIKFNPEKRAIRGDFHVMIVSNDRLRIALEGDEEAWGRRLLVIDFQNPKPAKPISNFAEVLLEQESSGILNWLIEGAMEYQKEMKVHGRLCLNEAQTSRVKTLLEDSDNVAQFVNQSVVLKEGGTVTSDELLVSYYNRCESRNLRPAASQTFLTRMPDLLGQRFKKTRRNDIKREDKAVRGFKGLALVA